MRLLRALMPPCSSSLNSRNEACKLCSGVEQEPCWRQGEMVRGLEDGVGGWTGLTCSVLASQTLSSRRSLLVMPLSQESVFFRDISSWDLVLSGRVSKDSALETLLQGSGFTAVSLKRAQPLAFRGSADLHPTRLLWWRMTLETLEVEHTAVGGGLSVTITILVEARTSCTLG